MKLRHIILNPNDIPESIFGGEYQYFKCKIIDVYVDNINNIINLNLEVIKEENEIQKSST